MDLIKNPQNVHIFGHSYYQLCDLWQQTEDQHTSAGKVQFWTGNMDNIWSRHEIS